MELGKEEIEEDLDKKKKKVKKDSISQPVEKIGLKVNDS